MGSGLGSIWQKLEGRWFVCTGGGKTTRMRWKMELEARAVTCLSFHLKHAPNPPGLWVDVISHCQYGASLCSFLDRAGPLSSPIMVTWHPRYAISYCGDKIGHTLFFCFTVMEMSLDS